jgi:hypothetical protein
MTIYYNYKNLMLVLARLVFIAVSLFMFINLFLTDFDDKKNSISYKIYLFLFVFVLNFMFQIFANLINHIKISMDELIEMSINNALLSVVAYGIYDDLSYNGFFNQNTHYQKSLILILLIIGFITTIKILELLISSN